MNYTDQEIKNHKQFAITFIFFILNLGLILFSGIERNIIIGFIGYFGAVGTCLYIFWIGYSHGWELNRISGLRQAEEEEQ